MFIRTDDLLVNWIILDEFKFTIFSPIAVSICWFCASW